MRTLGIIPARYQSSRFPGKPLADILGKSMIQRVYEHAKKSKLDDVIVATDDDRIAEEVKSFNGEVRMTSDQHLSGTDRCMEVAESVSKEFDIIVNIQGDEPFIEAEQINQLIDAFGSPDTQIATLAQLIEQAEDLQNYNKPKVLFDEKEMVVSFERVVNSPFKANTFYKHIGLYAFRPEILKEIAQLKPSVKELELKLEQWRWLENDYNIKIKITPYDTYSVDTKDDLKKIIERFG